MESAVHPPLYSLQPFSPQSWMSAIRSSEIPSSRVVLASLPTPVHRVRPFTSKFMAKQEEVEIFIKRDDLTSYDLSGNKVRKLEFLLADALEKGYDSVITIGGLQSNHCRATAVAARQLGLSPILILRTELSPEEITLEGNLLLSRMAGAKIYTVKPEEYYEKGGDHFVHKLAKRLRSEGRKCYAIPCGGSNVLGTFGYLNAVTELIKQCENDDGCSSCASNGKRSIFYDHIVFACGSGGTAAGLAIGANLAQLDVQLHAIGVCDSPDEFYEIVRQKAECLGLHDSTQNLSGGQPPLHEEVRAWLNIYDGQGLGYGICTQEELEFLYEVSSQTGISLDPVYSGKAFFTFCTRLMKDMPEVFKPGDKVLFVHTGGSMGSYAKEAQLLPLVTHPTTGQCIQPL